MGRTLTLGKRCGALILACLPLASPAAAELQTARDLAADARRANAAGAPLVVIYSRDDCSFCQTIKRQHLRPLGRDARYADKIVMREVRQDSRAPLVDFSGQRSTHADFARQQKIHFVPVVAFYGAGGKELAPAIVGARIPDFYQGYLEDAVNQATQALKTP